MIIVLRMLLLLSHLNILTFFSLTGGCSEGLDAFKVFFKNQFVTIGSRIGWVSMMEIFKSRMDVETIMEKCPI